MSAQQEQGLVPPSHGDMRGACLGWGFPWGQQWWLAAFLREGVWGHGCARQWRFVLLLLRSHWKGVQSWVKLSCSLLSSLCSSWVGATLCRDFRLADAESHFLPGTSLATAPAAASL